MKTIVTEFEGMIIDSKTRELTEYRRVSGSEALQTRKYKRINANVLHTVLLRCLECGCVVVGDSEGRQLHYDWHQNNG